LTRFSDLGLATPILEALAAEGYESPTPIQAQAIPYVLAGRDLLGIAQTGTGKTAAFACPILHRLAAQRRPAARRGCRTLVLSPTRELASQIADSFRAYGRNLGLSTTVVFGGVNQGPQVRALANGIDVLVATPGRLMDLIGQNAARLDAVEVLVLDEADQMLDMGFIHAIRKLVRLLPKQRQNLFFSATMPQEIGTLAGELLRDPAKVAVAPVATTVERVEQRVIHVDANAKRNAIVDLLRDASISRTLVFTRTKHGADKLVRHLEGSGIAAAAIHGNKSQSQRERALAAFREGRSRILVATDIAARGIDVDAVSHVINYDLPNIPESYVHRIGRTARAGAAGIAISLCAPEERAYLRDIEKLIRFTLPATGFAGASEPHAPRQEQAPRHQQQRNGRGRHPQARPQHQPRQQQARPQEARQQEGRSQEARPQEARHQDGRHRNGNHQQNRHQEPRHQQPRQQHAQQQPVTQQGSAQRHRPEQRPHAAAPVADRMDGELSGLSFLRPRQSSRNGAVRG
jgi:ATP-dependent RNA helicase RhlE